MALTVSLGALWLVFMALPGISAPPTFPKKGESPQEDTESANQNEEQGTGEKKPEG